MKDDILKRKSKPFALRIIKLHKFLREERQEYVMSKQVLRSGTSIGANIAEGYYAQSDADLINKYSIALKEAAETAYWLELLHESLYIETNSYASMDSELTELIKLLTASIKTLKRKTIE